MLERRGRSRGLLEQLLVGAVAEQEHPVRDLQQRADDVGAQIGNTGEQIRHRGEHDDERDTQHAGRQQPARAAGVERAG